jgi:hypothetical protein
MSERIIFANFDLKNVKDPESNFYNIPDLQFNVLNNISDNIVLGINNNLPPTKLVFSTNGVDGIGVNDTTFGINTINYTNQKIYFVVRLKNVDNFQIKNAPRLDFYDNTDLYSIGLSCFDEFDQSVNTTFVSKFDKETSLGGFFKGYFLIDTPINNIKLKGEVLTETGTVTGVSNNFNVYDKSGLYDYRKINEDNDQQSNYKNLIFQDILLNKENFFDNFLGTIVGNLSSNPNSLGIKIYEKISNFVSNNSDIDFSNFDSFNSMLDNLDISVEEYRTIFPPDLKRLVDNLSINLSKQKGQKNQFNQNFDDKGYQNSNFYGLNKGNALPVLTTVLTAGRDTSYIVAKENFSGKYKLLNTNILSAYDPRFTDLNSFTYNLSTYNNTWGWGLILPDNLGKRNYIILQRGTKRDFLALQDGDRLRTQDFDSFEGDISTLENFYTFYDYISSTEDSYLQKYIDFDNPNTSVGNLNSFSSYSSDSGVIDELVLNLLTQKTVSLDNKISDLIKIAVEAEKANTNFDTEEFALLESQYGIDLSLIVPTIRDTPTEGDSGGGDSDEDIDDFVVITDETILVDSDGNPIVLDDGDFIEIVE